MVIEKKRIDKSSDTTLILKEIEKINFDKRLFVTNKLAYGARLFNLFDAVEGKKVEIRRAPGYTRVKNNDVVVFHIPHPNT